MTCPTRPRPTYTTASSAPAITAAVEVRRTTFAPIPPPVCPSEVTTIMPKASAAIESIVMYPSSKPAARGVLVYSPVGASWEAGNEARERNTSRMRSPSRMGVSILPRLSMMLRGFQHR